MAKAELVFGVHAVRALVERDPAGVLEVWLQARREPPALRRALSLRAASGIAVHRVARETIERMVGSVAHRGAHQGVVARYRPSAPVPVATLDQLLDRTPPPSLIVVLDEVQDPRNLGACMRCAAGAGADALVIAKRRSASLTATARKAASGAAEQIPLVTVTNLASALKRMAESGISVIGAAADAERSLYDMDLRGPHAIVLGGEERGLRRLTRERCRQMVSIPLRGPVESLNVSVAAAVFLFEAVRQRSTGGRADKSAR
ncbi:MAG: 23S rRNA (guanosine(2251)-2'-O)-methyltransferase RlmB [Gammaproteobacteria bacterium]|nr:23S rRNA (guanosine(2251)-2'-O)-methyltransferase RlmB [Gammaproteobacteria bacterium]